MDKISSKYLSLIATEDLLKAEKTDNSIVLDGILLLTNFGMVLGKIRETKDKDNIESNADWIMNHANALIKANSLEDKLIGDGSVIILEDVIIKYPNNSTITLSEIIIFCDQVVGFYPIDLQSYKNQLSQ